MNSYSQYFEVFINSAMENIKYELMKQGLEEASIRDLETNIQRGFPNTKARQHAVGPIQVPIVKLTPFAPSGKLFAESQANNQGRKYNPEIMFDQVQFEKEETATNVTFTGSDNNEYNITQAIPLAGSAVQVRCNCLDFHYRFSRLNAKNNALYGNPAPPYKRHPDSNRPPANPAQVPGMCKHLLALKEELQKMGIVAKG